MCSFSKNYDLTLVRPRNWGKKTDGAVSTSWHCFFGKTFACFDLKFMISTHPKDFL
jgi:hypothetical protein